MQKLTFKTFVEVTRFEQSLFGLPFIVAGALLPFAFSPWHTFLRGNALWILPAFFAARISGMAFNQMIDRHSDAQNPRTQGRVLPSGRASVMHVRMIAWGSLFLFILLCMQINELCGALSPLPALLIYFYSYTKRIHVGCHFVLGAIHCLGPIMAAVAISGMWLWPSLWLGLAACSVIAGNDIVYAIQDQRFDQKHHLYSLPARYGVRRSLQWAKGMHALCMAALICLGITMTMRWGYYVAPLGAFFCFLDFHQKIKPLGDAPELSLHVTPLFFRCNVSVSLLTLLGIVLGMPWKG